MLVPVKWLKDYVDIDVDSRELADRLTMSGSHVDSIYKIDKGVEKVVVGKITNIISHPNADKLVITTIDIGKEELQIVTGASNIKIGDYVPVALVGARLPGGVKIKKGKLRGEESFGMLCSAKELGIADNVIPKEAKDGIYILDKEYPLGKDIKEILELDGEVIEFEITPNRPDCLSMVGMARETAATLNKKLKYPDVEIKNEVDDIHEYLNGIEVIDKNLCKRYYARVVKDIKINPSPLWLQMRLIEAGVRPINNIVDITNYVMLELGQPLHAFDLDKVEDKLIIIRRAKTEEKITTLDTAERKLSDNDLIIADSKKPIGIAGVMGGLESEVTNDTGVILIESANFDGRSVRLTSKRVGLRTEASARFEKNLDANIAKMACNRACQLIEEVGAGTVVKGYIDIYKEKAPEKVVVLRIERVKRLLGIDIEKEKMINILNSLELNSEINEDKIRVNIPTYRQDLELEADLIEEIGRIYNFEQIKPQPLRGSLTRGEKSTDRNIKDKAKNILLALGLNEITTYSFISPKAYDKINLPEESIKRKYVKLINPLGEDYSVMRTTLIPNMLEVLSRNFNYGVDKAYAFEIGNIFVPKEIPIKTLPYENKTLCLGMYGEIDFFDIKGVLEELFNRIGINNYDFYRETNHSVFHPGRCANIIFSDSLAGVVGEVHPDVLKNYGIKEKVYMAEINFEKVILNCNFEKKYKPLPKYPAIDRDLAIVVNDEILVSELEKIIWENGNDLVDKVDLFDVYIGKQIPKGKKSVAYSISYRSMLKTLTDDEVTKVHDKIISELKDKFNAELRS